MPAKKLGCKRQTKTLTVPTLSIGSKYDTMDPEHMKWIANEVQNGRFYFAQMAVTFPQYDDQKNILTD
jgi:proline iminopeptidase